MQRLETSVVLLRKDRGIYIIMYKNPRVYLQKELDTRKYLNITRDHSDINAKLPELHLLPLASGQRGTSRPNHRCSGWLAVKEEDVEVVVWGCSPVAKREGGGRNPTATESPGGRLGLPCTTAFQWFSGDERRLPGCGSSSRSSAGCSLALKTDGGGESTANDSARREVVGSRRRATEEVQGGG
jgi:hypothetical protein